MAVQCLQREGEAELVLFNKKKKASPFFAHQVLKLNATFPLFPLAKRTRKIESLLGGVDILTEQKSASLLLKGPRFFQLIFFFFFLQIAK